jgi:4-hydroxy-3-polyprenylbenzoate decarboxylase
MCVDATKKFPQEISVSSIRYQVLGLDSIKNKFVEIVDVNYSLLKKGISVLFISIEKNRKNHIKELNEQLFSREEFQNIKFVIYVEHTIDVMDIKDTMWRFANNFDPKRDSFFSTNGIGMDGTRKTKQFDDFDRPWPNIICSDDATIKSVDEKWNKLGLGTLITSPSLKYKKMLYKGGAVAEE